MLKLAIVLILLPFALFMVISMVLSVVLYVAWPLIILALVIFAVWLLRRLARHHNRH